MYFFLRNTEAEIAADTSFAARRMPTSCEAGARIGPTALHKKLSGYKRLFACLAERQTYKPEYEGYTS